MRGGTLDGALAAGMAHGDDVAVPIGADLVGEVARPGADDILNGAFVTGGTGGFEELL